MVLPKSFQLHESRLTKESLDTIEFQYERLDQDSSDYKTFLNRFLRISKSPTIPPEDYEIWYLASKIAYFLSDYEFFNTEDFKEKASHNNGSRIWYSLAMAAQGNIDEAIKTLERIKEISEQNGDFLQYIECLGVLAQIYFVSGTKSKEKLAEVMEKIDKFKEENQGTIPNYDHMFMPAYLIKCRINAQQLAPKDIIKETLPIYELAKAIPDQYWITHFELDLVQAYVLSSQLDEADNHLNEILTTLQSIKFPALEAKAIRIKGQYLERKGEYERAEKSYLGAKEVYKVLKDQIGVSACVSRLAKLAELQEQQNKAEQYFNESYSISEKMTDYYGMAVALTSLARISYQRSQYAESAATFNKALEIAKENDYDYLLPSIYDGLAHVSFISGDFWSAVEARSKSVIFKEKLSYSKDELLIEHMKLGQLNALVGNLDTSFSEFEIALSYCMEQNRKDDIYFDILNWLFEISTAHDKLALAESYMSRADLFASIHNSKEENAQALISRIRFLIQKKELVEAEKLIAIVFEQAQDFPSPLTMALILVEKSVVLFMRFLDRKEDSILEDILQAMDDMLFISLDLEFLPLTMYTKKVLAKVLAYKNEIEDGIEELTEAFELAEELGMHKFEDLIKKELKDLEKLKRKELDEDAFEKKRDTFLQEGLEFLKETFWLVSASEYQ
ncbi:MAG: tetratricopeptide repeat protein [Candidatus Heimdallarchaeota archaeon]|nr:tetratricopeptide repeat protein [Candidatus Heimdallarchaeota archaeon]MBY8996033.1 tetratricopeptide repeat protein [Candidatus Heimdallarchaeota archaeon]